MADRMMVMRAGLVQHVGTPLDIYCQPTNLYVATFFGTPTMHILCGQVSQDRPYLTLVARRRWWRVSMVRKPMPWTTGWGDASDPAGLMFFDAVDGERL